MNDSQKTREAVEHGYTLDALASSRTEATHLRCQLADAVNGAQKAKADYDASQEALRLYVEEYVKMEARGEGWFACSERMPERQTIGYYGDRYSIPVLLNVKHAKLFRWDFQNDGWVEAGFSDGPSPIDYRGWGLKSSTHWMPLPPPPRLAAALAGGAKS